MNEEEAWALLYPRLRPMVDWLNSQPVQADLNARRREQNRRRNASKRKNHRPTLEEQITSNLRTRLYLAVRAGNARKSGKTLYMLGCTIPEFKAYIAAQFTEGMSWENYGEWHIDHKRPCASFNLRNPAHQAICFHHTNMQPMWAMENHAKGARYESVQGMSSQEARRIAAKLRESKPCQNSQTPATSYLPKS